MFSLLPLVDYEATPFNFFRFLAFALPLSIRMLIEIITQTTSHVNLCKLWETFMCANGFCEFAFSLSALAADFGAAVEGGRNVSLYAALFVSLNPDRSECCSRV